MIDVKDILIELGFSNISDHANYYRTKPIYRDSGNSSILSVNKKTGHFVDFGRRGDGIQGPIEKLVSICLDCSIENAKSWLKEKYSYDPKNKTVQIFEAPQREYKTLTVGFLNDLEKDHTYWIDRGISKDIIEIFEGGTVKSGQMKYRYVFPIFDKNKKLIGVTGRDLINDNSNSARQKWKHIGKTSKWNYPFNYNKAELLNSKRIFLVESIGNMLSLFNSGHRNVLVTFGTEISFTTINTLIRCNPEQICIAFDNDENMAGIGGANRTQSKLKKYFDSKQIKICLPDKNDIGEMSKEEIKKWMEKI